MQPFPTLPQEQKRHPQFILAIDASYFRIPTVTVLDATFGAFNLGITHYPAAAWIMEAQSFITIREREWLDNKKAADDERTGDPKYRQLLPYAAITQVQEDGVKRYFPYARTKMVGEQKLAGKVSVGYGGHPDLADVLFDPQTSVIDLRATLMGAAKREVLGEETVIYDKEGNVVAPSAISVTFADQFILQNTDPEILHVGIIMTLELPTGFTLKSGEVDELVAMAPMTAEELLASDYELEAWTKVLLEETLPRADRTEEILLSADATAAEQFRLSRGGEATEPTEEGGTLPYFAVAIQQVAEDNITGERVYGAREIYIATATGALDKTTKPLTPYEEEFLLALMQVRYHKLLADNPPVADEELIADPSGAMQILTKPDADLTNAELMTKAALANAQLIFNAEKGDTPDEEEGIPKYTVMIMQKANHQIDGEPADTVVDPNEKLYSIYLDSGKERALTSKEGVILEEMIQVALSMLRAAADPANLLLDGIAVNDADFNAALTGNATTAPTDEQITDYLMQDAKPQLDQGQTGVAETAPEAEPVAPTTDKS